MISFRVKVYGNQAVVANLAAVRRYMPVAIDRGLANIARHIHRRAIRLLNNKGKKGSQVPPGEYPVPVRTGHLKRSLDWLEPGESKDTEVGRFRARHGEAVVFDSARYAMAVHEGLFTHTKFGRRPYAEDALEEFARSGGIVKELEKQVRNELRRIRNP